MKNYWTALREEKQQFAFRACDLLEDALVTYRFVRAPVVRECHLLSETEAVAYFRKKLFEALQLPNG